MKQGNTRDVCRAFSAGKELKGYGSIRSERADDVRAAGYLMVGYSYAEPVVIHDGLEHLYSVRSWSVTTAGHIGGLRASAPGYGLPASTETLHDVARGRLSWTDAVERGHRIMEATRDRLRSKGVKVSRIDDGRYLVQGTPHEIRKHGRVWYCYAMGEDGVGATGPNYRTLKEAKVAAWGLPGASDQLKYVWATHDDVRAAESVNDGSLAGSGVGSVRVA